MFWNNVKIALRNLRKHKLFATINIVGLAIGLTIFVFGGLLVRYEQTHDAFFAKSDRIYTVGSYAAPELNLGAEVLDTTFTTVGPLIDAELNDVEATARTMNQQFLVRVGAESFYQTLRFADPQLLDIFDMQYIHGDEGALKNPSGLVLTESAAIKYFGTTDVMGEVVTLDNEFDFQVTAVIRDIPRNSHFNSLPIMDIDSEMFAPFKAMTRMRNYPEEGQWEGLSTGNLTYVLLPPSLDGDWLRSQLDAMYARVVPEPLREVIAGFWVNPVQHANLVLWDMFGMPIIMVIELLSLFVLIIAGVNYTNLATAQSLGRSREVGMRKTMGASRRQLLVQFLVESIFIAAIAMVIAIAVLEFLVPLFNNLSNKALTLNYLESLPWLLATVLMVGLLAGLYPAWLITRASPIDALRDSARKGRKGSRVRSFMIGAQFAISAFMLSLVAIVYMQNQQVKESSLIFPKSEVYTLARLDVDDIRDRMDTLRHELESLPNVAKVAYSFQVPYEQSNSTTNATARQGDEAGKFQIQYLWTDPEFVPVYDVPVLAGRNLSRDIAQDKFVENETEILNVVVNEMVLDRLGIATPEDALNKRFFELSEDNALREFIIVGVVPTQNITGLFNAEKPWVFIYNPDYFRIGSVRITGGSIIQTVEDIERVWKRVIPDYPIQGRFLDDVFNDVYNVLKYMNIALAAFAGVALALAMIGLFGLAAFMAAQRTKEIGVRKVLGANSLQIARLLVWQFSKPVIWALMLALPAAFFASNLYLNFFADRIQSPVVILLIAGAIAVALAWITVAGHAIRIARANPVLALRYE
jgi:putative ABC transport system permease protein